MKKPKIPAVHPGEILMEEFLKPMRISQNHLALNIKVPARRINEIVLGKRSLSIDTALRLARYFGNSPEFWLNLQMHFDLEIQKEKLGSILEEEIKVRKAS